MNSRERVLCALEHQEPDRVPIDLGHVGPNEETYRRLKGKLGLQWKEEDIAGLWGMHSMDPELLKRLHVDLRRVTVDFPSRLLNGVLEDSLGIKWVKTNTGWWPVEHPLARIGTNRDLEEYDWPNLSKLDLTREQEKAHDVATRLQREGWAVATDFVFSGPWETGIFLRGEVQVVKDMYRNPELARSLFQKISDVGVQFFDVLLEAVGDHVDIVSFSDDLGIQAGLRLSPRLYMEFVKPYEKIFLDSIHRMTDAKILFHSCGAIEPLINDLIEIGVDILNPLQPLAANMGNSRALKSKYGDRICFHGGVDTQRILPFGSLDDIEKEIQTRIRGFGPEGGYIVAPAQSLMPDVSPENIIAMADFALRAGKYPLGSLS